MQNLYFESSKALLKKLEKIQINEKTSHVYE